MVTWGKAIFLLGMAGFSDGTLPSKNDFIDIILLPSLTCLPGFYQCWGLEVLLSVLAADAPCIKRVESAPKMASIKIFEFTLTEGFLFLDGSSGGFDTGGEI